MMRRSDVIFFAVIIPIFEMFVIGYSLDINVKKIDTVIYDLAKTQDSRTLINEFINTDDFVIVKTVYSDQQMYDTLVGGQAKVAIKIPANYSQQLANNKTATVQILVDGSNAPITLEAVNTSNNLILRDSLTRLLNQTPNTNNTSIVEMRALVLFNPSNRSANFFLPGVLSFESSLLTILLASLSIVGEREQGNFDQLYMTPIDYRGMILGKILPYGVLAIVQEIVLIAEMRYIFSVPIQGSAILLVLLSLPYIVVCLGLGVIVASLTSNQVASIQLGTLFRILPAIYLSGYIFPIEGMPPRFQPIAYLIPEWHFMEISRGIIVRGATLKYLWPNELALIVACTIVFTIATILYRRHEKRYHA